MFTGEQAVSIPSANASELMLRHDVAEAIANSKFAIHAIDTIDEALPLMMSKDGMVSVNQDMTSKQYSR